MHSRSVLDIADDASFPANDSIVEVAQQNKRKVVTTSNSDFLMLHEMWFALFGTK